MTERISDQTIAYMGNLAKLSLSDQEQKAVKDDLNHMLEYFEQLNELDTSAVPPMSHIFSQVNVFRADIITNADNKEAMLGNAPSQKDGQYQVPKTVE